MPKLKDETKDFLSMQAGVYPRDTATVALGLSELDKLGSASVNRFLKGKKAARDKKSIIGMAAKNTFEFPVFVSKSVPIDYASASCALLEQTYASYIQMAISINPIVDARSLKNISGGGGLLAQFKTNTTKYVEYCETPYELDACHNVIDMGDTITEFDMITIEDEVAEMINECCSYEDLDEFNHFFMEAAPTKEVTKDEYIKLMIDAEIESRAYDVMTAGNPVDMNAIRSEIEHDSQFKRQLESDWMQFDKDQKQIHHLQMQNNDMQSVQGGNGDPTRNMTKAQIDNLNKQTSYYEKQIEKINAEIAKINREAGESGARVSNLQKQKELYESQKKKIDHELSDVTQYDASVGGLMTYTAKDELYAKRKKMVADADKAETDAKKAKSDAVLALANEKHEAQRWQMEKNRDARERMTKAPEMMDETKINKLNGLKPLMMRCQVRVSNPDGNITEYPVELICGVKCHCRMIDPEILPDVAKYPLEEMKQITRNVKYKAGELKFFKDLVFNVKEKKQTAIDSRDPNRRWYRRLYQLAHMKGDAGVSQAISGNGSTGLIPNASMIITNSDVENVKAATKIDLLKGSTACKFCKELFMMGMIVIDQDQQSIKTLLPEFSSEYDVQSLDYVEKKINELSAAGAKTRDIFKLLK